MMPFEGRPARARKGPPNPKWRPPALSWSGASAAHSTARGLDARTAWGRGGHVRRRRPAPVHGALRPGAVSHSGPLAPARPVDDAPAPSDAPASRLHSVVQLVLLLAPAVIILAMGWHRRWLNED